MSFTNVEIDQGIATVVLSRGKVNALNADVVNELRNTFNALETEQDVKGIILTGYGEFFSFGFDIPEFLSFSKEEFTKYLIDFTDLYTYLFLYPKTIIAALNGHTIAGGCMLSLACDKRIMVGGKYKISLNEISFGSSVFAGSTEMLRFWIGSANATQLLYSGAMYTATEAMGLGLIDVVTTQQDLMAQAGKIASDIATKHLPAFSSIKKLLRQNVAQKMMQNEEQSISEFVDIWYSQPTWTNLQNIQIR